MNRSTPPASGYQSRTRTNVIRLLYWNGAWGLATVLMALGPQFFWNKIPMFTLLSVALDLALGVGMILANKRYIVELDELQQKVQLNSLAITVGVAAIVGVPLSVMNAYHVLPFRADIAHLVVLMALTYVVSNLYGTRRYR